MVEVVEIMQVVGLVVVKVMDLGLVLVKMVVPVEEEERVAVEDKGPVEDLVMEVDTVLERVLEEEEGELVIVMDMVKDMDMVRVVVLELVGAKERLQDKVVTRVIIATMALAWDLDLALALGLV